MWEYFSDRYDPSRPPVLMTAGFLESGAVYDLPERRERSLARYLAEQGWHVWVLDFRGSGTSHLQPIFTADLLPMDGWRFNADDYIHNDLPAAVDYIRNFTGKPRLFLVGHSIGALAAFGYVETHGDGAIQGIVSLGGVLVGGGAGGGTLFSPLFLLLQFVAPLVPNDLIFPLWFAAIGVNAGPDWLFDFLVGFLQSGFGAMYWNAANMDSETISKVFAHGLANTSTTVIKQYLLWEQTGEVSNFGPNPNAPLNGLAEAIAGALFGASGGSATTTTAATSSFYSQVGFFSYTQHLSDVQVPALFVAGGADNTVPKENVQTSFVLAGSGDKEYLELFAAEGFSTDYGHLDMLLGTNARTEVFPAIHDWLNRHR
jgi:pimeloyl-ACP methyl ester carboxylesterase